MKLKEIPYNTVVSTPTLEDAKELLQILHENGYEWYHKNAPIPNPRLEKIAYINIYHFLNGYCNVFTYCDKKTYVERFITLAKFKEKYCDLDDTCTDGCSSAVQVEKPQPKFREGELVMFPEMDRPLQIHAIVDGVAMSWWDDGSIRATSGLDYLKPYTEPETKDENKELNLVELLHGHEGEKVYSLYYGECELVLVRTHEVGRDNTEAIITDFRDNQVGYRWDGKAFNGGDCLLFPSRELYEKYPLDAKKSWDEWKKEQNKTVSIEIVVYTQGKEALHLPVFYASLSDRDKCINEIKEIIEKYSKK